MEKLMECFSPDQQSELKKLFEMKPPIFERSQLWGHNTIPGFSAEAAKYAYEKWEVRENDVFVSTYPKTGTNFINDIVRRILYQDEKTTEIISQIPTAFAFVEFGGEKKFELFDKLPLKRRTMATHLPADLMNMEKIKKANAKVIYILRNPKDQIVSWLKFIETVPMGDIEPWKSMIKSGWEKYLDHVISGDFDMNMKPGEWYPDHILSWCKHRDGKTVYFAYFENFKTDPVKEIKLMAEFLEVPLSSEKAEEIAKETSFEKMKEGLETITNPGLKMFRSINMRKGGVGGWKDHFTVSQSERIDAIMEEKLKDTDIKFTYELEA